MVFWGCNIFSSQKSVYVNDIIALKHNGINLSLRSHESCKNKCNNKIQWQSYKIESTGLENFEKLIGSLEP